MPTHNFWYWFLEGVGNVILTISSFLPIHAPIGFVDFVQLFMNSIVGLFVFIVGSYLNLTWLAIFVGLMIVLEIARAGIAAYRLVVGFIPLP